MDEIVHGNVAFMILAIVLVFFMTPGLALFYGGLIEKKHTLTLMTQVMISICIVTLLWVICGFSLVFGRDILGIIGNPFDFTLKNIVFEVNRAYGLTIPFLLFFMYQLMFAIITLPLMTGSIVNRITIRSWIVYLITWMFLVYFPVAHWIWGGGFLAKMGFVDFAGGTVIHITAAFSGLSALWVLGKRKIQTKKGPFNMGMVAVGGSILLFGWFGFNAGGTLAAAEITAIVIANTGIASASGMFAWSCMGFFQKKKCSFLDLLVGAIAGLAAITPASGFVTPDKSIIIGLLAGVFCYFAIKIPHKMQWDDVLDVWGVHGVGGFWGTISVGLFANIFVGSIEKGMHQFGIQLLGASLVAVYSMFMSYIIMKILDKNFDIRVTKSELEEGLDKSLLNEEFSD